MFLSSRNPTKHNREIFPFLQWSQYEKIQKDYPAVIKWQLQLLLQEIQASAYLGNINGLSK